MVHFIFLFFWPKIIQNVSFRKQEKKFSPSFLTVLFLKKLKLMTQLNGIQATIQYLKLFRMT